MKIETWSKFFLLIAWTFIAVLWAYSGFMSHDALFIGLSLICSAWLSRRGDDED